MNDFDDVACAVTVDRGMLLGLCSTNIGEERFDFPHTLHTWFLAGQVCPDWCEGLQQREQLVAVVVLHDDGRLLCPPVVAVAAGAAGDGSFMAFICAFDNSTARHMTANNCESNQTGYSCTGSYPVHDAM